MISAGTLTLAGRSGNPFLKKTGCSRCCFRRSLQNWDLVPVEKIGADRFIQETDAVKEFGKMVQESRAGLPEAG